MTKPIVLIIGGPDVNTRLDLMGRLKDDFEMAAAGTAAEIESRFRSAGFRYYFYPLQRTVSPLSDLHSIHLLHRLCRTVGPHVVHTFDAKPSVWGRLAARWAGVPVVVGTMTGLGSLYSSDRVSTRVLRSLYEIFARWACHVADLTIFQNRYDARQFIASRIVAENKAMVIPGSGVATETYAPNRVLAAARKALRAELGFTDQQLVVTMISRVIRSKGVLEFMAAAQEVSARHPWVRFLLVGPNDESSLDRLSRTELAQLKQLVHWSGSRKDVPVVLASSDIFVLPSGYREGIPRVLLEAASMGLPIITTDSAGCNEVVEDGVNGLLVPPRDATALGGALLQLAVDSELRERFGRESRRRALERFDLSIIVEQTRSVYRRLLADRLPPGGSEWLDRIRACGL